MTLRIDGPSFPLQKFREAIDSFAELLTEIDKETSPDSVPTVEWVISSIESGSLVITAEANPIAESIEPERIEELVNTVSEGFKAIESSPVRPNGFSNRALISAKKFAELIDPDNFAEINLSGDDWRVDVQPRIAANVDELTKASYKFYGSVEGTLVSITTSGQQSFGIQSPVEGRIVKCFFKDDLFEEARDALKKRVYVFGLIRQYVHGPKINIQVEELKVLPSVNEAPTLAELSRMLRGEV
jgi:hypothetical protein